MDVDTNQPLGTPTWIDLGVPDLDRAQEFYGAVFGWEFAVGPEEYGSYTTCLLRGRAVAREAGGEVLVEPTDIREQGRMAVGRDPAGAVFGLWQGSAHIGCQVVNEPGSLVRNDLVTSTPEPARQFYAQVFGFTLDRNDDMPGFDFTFLRRPDGHEVGGIMGAPDAPSAWNTTFEVAGTDDVVRRAREADGSATDPEDVVYGRMATVTDPLGAQFTVITRPAR